VAFEPLIDAACLKGLHDLALLDFLESLGVCDHFNEAASLRCLHTGECQNTQVVALQNPELVHYIDQLQNEHVLAQIVADLVDCVKTVGCGIHVFEDQLERLGK